MKIRAVLSDISASAVNQIANQGLGFVYFLLIAAWMPKSEMGIYAFCIAAAQFSANLLTFGTSPIIIRRIAGRASPVSAVAGSALFQRLAFPIVFATLILPVVFLYPEQIKHPWLLAVAFLICSAGQFAIVGFQVLIAEQKFWLATLVQQTGMIIKLGVGLTLVFLGYGAFGLFIALLASFVVEIVFTFFVVKRVLGVSLLPRLNRSELWLLIKEGMPLALAMIFSRTLARIDWILMGIMRTEVETGEYAFVYRLFELSWMPHAIWGVLLLPKLSAALANGRVMPAQQKKLTSLHRLMVAVSILLPLIMTLAWTPVVDTLTGGKYGAVNERTILILAVAVPFVAGTGIMWNTAMALQKTRTIMLFASGTSLINVGLNIILIPKLGGLGAAISTCIPMILQYFGYVVMLRSHFSVRSALGGLACSVGSGLAAFGIVHHFVAFWPLKIVVALAVYGTLVWLARAASKEDWNRVLNRGG